MRRRIMVFIMQTICIRPMRSRTSKFLATFIHFLDKRLKTSAHLFADTFCDCIRHLIGRCKQHTVQRIVHTEYFSRSHPDTRISVFQKRNAVFGKINFVIRIRIFQRHKRCQQFCNACRIMLIVYFFPV